MTTADSRITVRLSRLLKRPVADRGGESIGRLADVIVRLRGTDYPLGVITVDDVIEVVLPDDWRRREVAEPPDARHADPG